MIAHSLRAGPATETEWLGPVPVRQWFAHPERRLEVDLGCGKGRFLLAHAARHPQTNFLGIDRMLRRIRAVDNRARRLDLDNIRLMRVEAYYAVAYLLPPGAVDTYYIFFPDPWPKKRHHKRRLVTAGFIETLQASLIAGGCIFFATDFKDYFDIMIAGARTCPGLTELGCATVLPPDVNPETAATSYERKYLIQGRPIYKAVYKKT